MIKHLGLEKGRGKEMIPNSAISKFRRIKIFKAKKV